MSFVIRKGDKNDVPGIFRLIKELAEFERAPEAVINSEKILLKDGFSEPSIYKVIVAEDVTTNDIIGMALYYTAYSTWKGKMFYLDDLVVTEKFRRFSIGTQLINAFLQDAAKEEVSLVKWQVLEWNTPAIEFYKKLGVVFDSEWIDCKLYKDQIAAYVKNL